MSVSYVVEADRRVVGVAVQCEKGFRFFASDPQYTSLDRRTFPRARTLDGEIRRHAQRLQKRGGAENAKMT
jgi:hypothetical protein